MYLCNSEQDSTRTDDSYDWTPYKSCKIYQYKIIKIYLKSIILLLILKFYCRSTTELVNWVDPNFVFLPIYLNKDIVFSNFDIYLIQIFSIKKEIIIFLSKIVMVDRSDRWIILIVIHDGSRSDRDHFNFKRLKPLN